jgi:hypothetical protein
VERPFRGGRGEGLRPAAILFSEYAGKSAFGKLTKRGAQRNPKIRLRAPKKGGGARWARPRIEKLKKSCVTSIVVKKMAGGELIIKGEPVEPEVRELIATLCVNLDSSKNTIDLLFKMLSDNVESLRICVEKRDVKGAIAALVRVRGFAQQIAEAAKMHTDLLTMFATKPGAATAMRLMLRD